MCTNKSACWCKSPSSLPGGYGRGGRAGPHKDVERGKGAWGQTTGPLPYKKWGQSQGVSYINWGGKGL